MSGAMAIVRVTESQSGIMSFKRACLLPLYELFPSYPFAVEGNAEHQTISLSFGLNVQRLRTHHIFFSPSQSRTLDALSSPSHISFLPEGEEEPDNFTCIVRGPKSVGKSTFIRSAVYAMISSQRTGRLAFLETDVGQPQFGPPGSVALHLFDTQDPFIIGPEWCTHRVPLRSHFIGDVSPREEPRKFLSAVEDLVNYYQRFVQHRSDDQTPMLINTMGWIKGLGADLLAKIEDLTFPSHIFDIIPPPGPGDDTVEPVTTPSRGPRRFDNINSVRGQGPVVVPLEPSPGALLSNRVPASEARMLSLMSYLYSHSFAARGGTDLKGGKEWKLQGPCWNFTDSLVTRPPLVIDVQSGLLGGIHILSHGANPPRALCLAALNASLVAIVRVEDGEEEEEEEEEGEKSNAMEANPASEDEVDRIWLRSFSRPLPQPSSSTCLGYGIVRSIDTASAKLHLLTPVSTSMNLATPFRNGQRRKRGAPPKIALIKGALDLPVFASLDFDYMRSARKGEGIITGQESRAQKTMAGVSLSDVPYIEFPKHREEEKVKQAPVGTGKRKFRRNIARRAYR